MAVTAQRSPHGGPRRWLVLGLEPDQILRSLAGRGLRLGVCSNKPVDFTRELLAYLEIAPYLQAVLGPEDVARPKPAPDMLLAGLERLGVPRAAALYVGDMTVDVQTARAAGVAVWIVPTGSDSREAVERARPDRLCRDLREVQEALVPLAPGGAT